MKFEIPINITEAIFLEKSLKYYLSNSSKTIFTKYAQDTVKTLVTKIGGTIADYNFNKKGSMENPVD